MWKDSCLAHTQYSLVDKIRNRNGKTLAKLNNISGIEKRFQDEETTISRKSAHPRCKQVSIFDLVK